MCTRTWTEQTPLWQKLRKGTACADVNLLSHPFSYVDGTAGGVVTRRSGFFILKGRTGRLSVGDVFGDSFECSLKGHPVKSVLRGNIAGEL